MRRALGIVAVAAALGGAWTLGSAAGPDDGGAVKYEIELDNAFGLIEGADVKIAGVRAGKITSMDVDRRDLRALIGVEIRREGFGDLRTDAFCETRPQSLIGEYFIDCRPGTAARKLPDGARLPVSQTGSTVPADLVANIMRRPYRERLSILLSELGAGLAARGEDLNETIRRANPALRETNRVLAELRAQRHVIRDLNRDADTVLKDLADNRGDVTRWVAEARDTARVSAAHAPALRRQLRALPTFLAELGETMPLLGEAAERQEGALSNLQANAGLLRRFLDDLGPFSDASRPAVRSLGAAAKRGRDAMIAARPRITELRRALRPAPELGQNLAITLEHLDDRKYAVEKDPRSPGDGAGYTGIESLLRYIWGQSMVTNLVDGSNYILKVAAFLDPQCAFFRVAADAKNPVNDRCAAILGPNRPGINSPDPTATTTTTKRAGRKQQRERKPAATAPSQRPATPAVPKPKLPGTDKLPPILPEIQKLLDDLLPQGLPQVPELLDFLLAP